MTKCQCQQHATRVGNAHENLICPLYGRVGVVWGHLNTTDFQRNKWLSPPVANSLTQRLCVCGTCNTPHAARWVRFLFNLKCFSFSAENYVFIFKLRRNFECTYIYIFIFICIYYIYIDSIHSFSSMHFSATLAETRAFQARLLSHKSRKKAHMIYSWVTYVKVGGFLRGMVNALSSRMFYSDFFFTLLDWAFCQALESQETRRVYKYLHVFSFVPKMLNKCI